MSSMSVSFELIISFSVQERLIAEVTQNTECFQNDSVTNKTSGQLEK